MLTLDASLLVDAVDRQAEQPGILRHENTAVQLANSYDDALEYGISVDETQWQALNSAAWPILVSATDQSRQGAGPG